MVNGSEVMQRWFIHFYGIAWLICVVSAAFSIWMEYRWVTAGSLAILLCFRMSYDAYSKGYEDGDYNGYVESINGREV